MTAPARHLRIGALKTPRIARIWLGVSLRPLFATLIAAAMLFAPLAMQAGSAMAMAPADHHAQMMDKGHCGDQPAEGEDGKMMGKSCCVAMCTGVAVSAAVPMETLAFARIVDRPSLEVFHHSYLAKLATPPPRRA